MLGSMLFRGIQTLHNIVSDTEHKSVDMCMCVCVCVCVCGCVGVWCVCVVCVSEFECVLKLNNELHFLSLWVNMNKDQNDRKNDISSPA